MSEPTAFPGPLPATPARLGPGSRLSDIYEIDSLIGMGGMGEVFRGHAIETGDAVAIKTIRPEMAQNAAALALFRREASALHNLYHQAIVRYFVFTIDRTLGVPYLAMEYVSGEPLTDLMARGPVPVDVLAVLLRRITGGLAVAHELGIVHRDISPDNVILPDGDPARAKIIDFGIARSKLSEGTVIGDGFAGKFGYVSPEQLGLNGGDVTGQSDIYSLGLVIAEAALGRRLDMGKTHAEVIDRRRTVPDLSGVPPRLRPLLEAMLQPDPKVRTASMEAVAAALPAPARSEARPARAASGGRGLLFGGIAAAVLALAGAGTYFGTDLLRPRDAARPSGSGVAAPSASPSAPKSSPTPTSSSAPSTSATTSAPPAAPAPTLQTEVVQPLPTISGPSVDAARPAPDVSAPVVAALPPAAIPDANVPERISDFVRTFAGGSCFFAAASSVTARSATVDGMGASSAPFVTLDADFKRAFGFEADIHLQQVARSQCPIVDLLGSRIGQGGARAPILQIASDTMRGGDELSGSVGLWPDAQVELFLVGDDGLAQSLSRAVRRSGDTATFRAKLDGVGRGQSKPELLVAVVSSRPIPSLRGTTTLPAERFVREIASDVARPGSDTAVAVKYLTVSN